jgi:multiple sugar transport system permease protein
MRTTSAPSPAKKRDTLRMGGGASSVALIGPYVLMFTLFITIPVIAAALLSLTYFNTVQAPTFVGLQNYIALLTQDDVFMQKVIPNTITFAVVVGPGGYALSFLLAWMLAQIQHKARTVLALFIYAPSMVGGVFIAVVWRTFFSGDSTGYLNAALLSMGLVDAPVQWLQDPHYIMPIMIAVSLWSSMGVGFLAMLAGILNINEELYEAAYIDGMKTRFQEIFYVTIPSMRPQMLFGAVMAIVSTFTAGSIGVALTGSNPTPQYAGQLVVNHMEDYAFLRYEMGYASAVSVVLLLMVYAFSKVAYGLFADREKGG